MATKTRAPTSDNSTGGSVAYSSGTTGYNLVNDHPDTTNPPTSYVTLGTTANSYILFNFTALDVPAGSTITNIIVDFRADDAGGGANAGEAMIRVGGTNYTTGGGAIGSSNAAYSGTWTQNPKTSAAWTVADVNGTSGNPLQAFGANGSDSNPVWQLASVELTVTYDPTQTLTQTTTVPKSTTFYTPTVLAHPYLPQASRFDNSLSSYTHTISNPGPIYWVIGPSSGWSDPTGAEVRAGQLSGGGAATDSGYETAPATTTNPFTFANDATGLTASTSYKIAYNWYGDNIVVVSDAWQTTGSGPQTLTQSSIFTNTLGSYTHTISTTVTITQSATFENSQTFYAPQVNLHLDPSRFNNTNTFYSPSLSFILNQGVFLNRNLVDYSNWTGSSGNPPTGWITNTGANHTYYAADQSNSPVTGKIVSHLRNVDSGTYGIRLTNGLAEYFPANTYTFSCYIRRWSDASGYTSTTASIALTGGTPSSINLATAAQIAAQPEGLWKRYSVTVELTGNTTNVIVGSLSGAINSGFQIAGFMVENGSSLHEWVGRSTDAYTLSSENLFYSADVDLTIYPDLFENTNTFYSASVGQLLSQDSILDHSNSFYEHTLTVGPVDLAVSRFDVSQTFNTHTISTWVGLTQDSIVASSETFYSEDVDLIIYADIFENINTFYTEDVDLIIYPSLFENNQTYYTHTLDAGAAPQELTPSLFSNTNTFYSADVDLIIYPGFINNTINFYDNSISNLERVLITWVQIVPHQFLTQDVLFNNSLTSYTHTLSTSEVILYPNRFDNTNTFYQPTVTPGPVTLTPSLFTNSQTFYSPSVGLNLVPELFTNSVTFYQPTITTSVTLTAGRFDVSQTFYDHQINLGIFATRFDNNQTFYTHVVTTGPVTLTPGLFTNSQTFYNHVVSTGEFIVAPELFTNSPTFYQPTITTGPVDLVPSRFDNSQTFYSASIEMHITVNRFDNSQEFYTHTLTPGEVILLPDRYDVTQTYYQHFLETGTVQQLDPTLFTNSQDFYEHTITQRYSPWLFVDLSTGRLFAALPIRRL